MPVLGGYLGLLKWPSQDEESWTLQLEQGWADCTGELSGGGFQEAFLVFLGEPKDGEREKSLTSRRCKSGCTPSE